VKKYRYEAVIRCTGTFELDDEVASSYDEDGLEDYARDEALDVPGTREVEDVEVTVV
jgi:hypothetical protein